MFNAQEDAHIQEHTPIRVCFICNEYPPGNHGGIGTSTQILARGLVEAGHEVRVTGIYRRGFPKAEYQEDQGVQVWRLQASGGRFGWLKDRRRLYRKISHWSRVGLVDVIDVPDYQGMVAGWPRLPVPVTTRICGSQTYFAAETQRSVKKSVFLLERASLRRSNFWCAKSNHAATRTKFLFGLQSGPHAIIHNPIDSPTACSPFARQANRVVFTGTLTAKKGIVALLHAWPQVRRARTDAELHVFGKDGKTEDGWSMRAHLQAILSERDAASVFFHGHVHRNTLLQQLQQTRVAVFPSLAETFGNAPLEAMSCGCATIYTTRAPGPELVEHGVSGLLVNPESAEDIAAAIGRLLEDRELAHRLGSAGRRCVQEKYSISKVVQDNVRYFRHCISEF